MIKMLVTFFILLIVIHLIIHVWQTMSKKEKWSTVKTVLYSASLSAITVSILTLFVLIF